MDKMHNPLIFILLCPVFAFAQPTARLSLFGKNLHQLRQLAAPETAPFFFLEKHRTTVFLKNWPTENAIPVANFFKKTALPPAFCAAELAFFCRLELKMDKVLRTPVRFRLGSQEYVDWLEGKSSARSMDFK